MYDINVNAIRNSRLFNYYRIHLDDFKSRLVGLVDGIVSEIMLANPLGYLISQSLIRDIVSLLVQQAQRRDLHELTFQFSHVLSLPASVNTWQAFK